MDDVLNISSFQSSERRSPNNIHNTNEKNKKILWKSELVIPKNDNLSEKKSNNDKINLTFDKAISFEENSMSSKSHENSSNNSSGRNRIKLPLFDLEKLKKSLSFFSEDSENKSKKMNEDCLICEEKLTNDEMQNNLVGCFHGFCDVCYYNYFREKINNNQIDRIICPQKDCNCKIFDEFIEKKLVDDIPLLEKYHKLWKRRQLALNPNIQLCPFPDCESYAEKQENNKYVSCVQNNHKFCFQCLKEWHGKKECSTELDKSFIKWRDSYKVKRCPKCKYFIEKNEGCNHMTCSYCKYQFCWLCMQEYKSGHYDLVGNCFGLQYSKSECFSNKLCIFLYNILIFFLKMIGFAILASFIFCFIIIIEIINNLYDYKDICLVEFLSYIIAILLLIPFSGLLLSISSLISILMVIIRPLRELIFEKLR